MNEGIKLCPNCAEEIKVAAIVCKHCGREIGEENSKVGKKIPWHINFFGSGTGQVLIILSSGVAMELLNVESEGGMIFIFLAACGIAIYLHSQRQKYLTEEQKEYERKLSDHQRGP